MIFVCLLLAEFSVKFLTHGFFFFIQNRWEGLYAISLICSFLGNYLATLSSGKILSTFSFLRCARDCYDVICYWTTSWTSSYAIVHSHATKIVHTHQTCTFYALFLIRNDFNVLCICINRSFTLRNVFGKFSHVRRH